MPRKKTSLPDLLTGLTLASLETIAHRTALMASGRCSQREYRRMVEEKLRAAQKSGLILMTGGFSPDLAARLLAPWHGGARRNARRLRRKG